MRKFKLKNNLGYEKDLNSNENYLSVSSGLGLSNSNDYERVESFFKQIQSRPNQKIIEGTMSFDSYSKYWDFISFIQQTPLTLEYTTDISRYIDVNISCLSLSEEDVYLTSSVTIEGLGAFYTNNIAKNDFDELEGKAYVIDGNAYKYDYSYAENILGEINYYCKAALGGVAKLTLLGPLINPAWQVIKNGTTILSGRVYTTIKEGHRLVIDCNPLRYAIYETDNANNIIRDCYNFSDFSTERFLKINNGTNKISVMHEGTSAIKTVLEVKELYV